MNNILLYIIRKSNMDLFLFLQDARMGEKGPTFDIYKKLKNVQRDLTKLIRVSSASTQKLGKSYANITFSASSLKQNQFSHLSFQTNLQQIDTSTLLTNIEIFQRFLGKVPPNELQIYTWMDASLKELMSLVREVNPESRKKGTYFDFAIGKLQKTRPLTNRILPPPDYY